MLYLCYCCDYFTGNKGDRRLHAQGWLHEMRAHFARKFISPEEIELGASQDFCLEYEIS